MSPEPDLRERVRELVSAYAPTGARDLAAQRETLAALDTLAEPFSRDAQAVHITASAIVAGVRGTLLHRHKITGTWLQPGGHVDPGETPWDAAVREVVEETGLSARHRAGPRLFDIDAHDTPRGHRHLDLRYLLDGPDQDPAPPPDESPDVEWMGWDEALRRADASLLEVLPKARRLAGVPEPRT